MRTRRSRGWIFKRTGKRGVTWYIAYYQPKGLVHEGEKLATCPDVQSGRSAICLGHVAKVREAAGKTKAEAVALLEERMKDLDGGAPARTAPLTFDDLLELVKSAWRGKGRKSSLTGRKGKETAAVRRLREHFGRFEARYITEVQIERFMNARLDEGAAKSTVRNQLNILKHAMTLAVEKRLLPRRPVFPEIKPDGKRTGFFERAEFEAVRAELPDYLRGAATFLFWSGWRSKSEAFTREWRHVDFEAGKIYLEEGETKNGEAREFPFGLIPELKAVIEAQRAYTDDYERRTGSICRWVFHKEGRSLDKGARFYAPWRAACERAGVPGRIAHDFRRTAVRNLSRKAGVSDLVAMELTGHKTRSVFDRYNIKDDASRNDAVAKLAAAIQPTGPDRSVLPLAREKQA